MTGSDFLGSFIIGFSSSPSRCGPAVFHRPKLAYSLVEALRRMALKGTEWAEAQVDTIRLKLFKIGALVRISARRVWLEMSSTYPWKQIYARAFDALRC